MLYGTALAISLSVSYYYVTDTRSSVHRYVVPRLLRALVPDAEDAHHYGTVSLKSLHKLGLNPRERVKPSPELETEVYGTKISNPIGIAGTKLAR